jgi:transcriptional regulator with XRE-family HTH domain
MAAKRESPTLIDQVKQAIRDSGMGVRELGRATGVEASRISRFMRGERSIDVAAVSAICQVLGYQLFRVPPRPPKRRAAGSDK